MVPVSTTFVLLYTIFFLDATDESKAKNTELWKIREILEETFSANTMKENRKQSSIEVKARPKLVRRRRLSSASRFDPVNGYRSEHKAEMTKDRKSEFEDILGCRGENGP